MLAIFSHQVRIINIKSNYLKNCNKNNNHHFDVLFSHASQKSCHYACISIIVLLFRFDQPRAKCLRVPSFFVICLFPSLLISFTSLLQISSKNSKPSYACHPTAIVIAQPTRFYNLFSHARQFERIHKKEKICSR